MSKMFFEGSAAHAVFDNDGDELRAPREPVAPDLGPGVIVRFGRNYREAVGEEGSRVHPFACFVHDGQLCRTFAQGADSYNVALVAAVAQFRGERKAEDARAAAARDARLKPIPGEEN